MYRSNEILRAVVMTFCLMLFNAEFVRAYKIDPKFSSVRKGTPKNNAFDYEPVETIPDYDAFNNSTAGADTNFLPGMDTVMVDPREILFRLTHYPIPYASHANNVPSSQDHYADLFPENDQYPSPYSYYPSVHPFASAVDPYAVEDIRYVPAMPEMLPMLHDYAQHQAYQATTGTPIPSPSTESDVVPPQTVFTSNGVVLPSEPAISNSIYPPSEVQDYMVKKIMQIVSAFGNANKTQTDDNVAPRDDMHSRLRPPQNESTLITTTTIEENNTTHVERDETKTEIHSGGNRTETAQIVRVPSAADLADAATTVLPERYVIEQFLDKQGNPCTKEVVVTSEKKTYYVYTCEEKGVPLTTTARPNVNHYRNELKTGLRDINIEAKTDEPTATSPMSADQTLSETLTDYAMFNKHE